ncbi:MAG TPA: hypothetical protein VGG25_17615 [Streptosporangiaceae bacterium]|jgi:hypothetical protein
MPAHVKAASKTGEQARALTSVVHDGTADPGKEVVFSQLDEALISVGIRDGGVVTLGEANEGIQASPLISCASICFLNTSGPTGYVYHANAGSISRSKFNDIMGDIGAREDIRHATCAGRQQVQRTRQGAYLRAERRHG